MAAISRTVAFAFTPHVVAWGYNASGQTNVPIDLVDVAQVASYNNHNIAIRRGGDVVAWGDWATPSGLTNIVSVATGDSMTLAVQSDGTVVGWGPDGVLQSNLFPELVNVTAVAVGDAHFAALKRNGTVVVWGQNGNGQLDIPLDLAGVKAIAAGDNHTLALRSNGTVVAWGYNEYGQTNVPADLTDVVAVSAGWEYSYALTRDGTVRLWGSNTYGQTSPPSDLSNVVAITAGFLHALAVRSDGTVLGWGLNNVGQTKVPVGLSGMSAVAAGANHSVAYTIPTGVTTLLNGETLEAQSVGLRIPAEVEFLSPFFGSTILYTTNGSDPSVSGILYTRPFTLLGLKTLRALAYSADFGQTAQVGPVEMAVLLAPDGAVEGGGRVLIQPPPGGFVSNRSAVVTALPDPGWVFLQWLGADTSAEPTIIVPVDRNKCLQAVFGTALASSVVGSGSTMTNPQNPWYSYGSKVVLTAVPQPGNYFALWGSAATGTNNPLTFAVTNPSPSIAAVFATLTGTSAHALTVIQNGYGETSTTPYANRYPGGTRVTLVARPAAGQNFVSWSGDANGTNISLVVTMNQSRVVVANFTRYPRLSPLLCGGLTDSDEFQGLLAGESESRYAIEGTAKLGTGTHWWSLHTVVTSTYGAAQFNDSSRTNIPHQFYRAVRIDR